MPDSFHGYTVSEFQPYNSSGKTELASVSDPEGSTCGFLWRYDGHDLCVDPGFRDDTSVLDITHALSLLAQLDCVIRAAGNLPLAITALQALQSATE